MNLGTSWAMAAADDRNMLSHQILTRIAPALGKGGVECSIHSGGTSLPQVPRLRPGRSAFLFVPGRRPAGSLPGWSKCPEIAIRRPPVRRARATAVVLTPERSRKAVAKGINHARAKGCQVISISLGIPTFLPTMTGGMGRAVDRAYEEGVIIAAAGGQIIDSVTYPGKYWRTIGVGGVTSERRIWFDYRDGRDMIDVWAPAARVLRADSVAGPGQVAMPPIEGADPGASALSSGSHSGGYGAGDGTSYATVHVAAAAAMWLRHRGDDIAHAYNEKWQRVEAFRRLLHTTAGPLDGAAPANARACSTSSSCCWPPCRRPPA